MVGGGCVFDCFVVDCDLLVYDCCVFCWVGDCVVWFGVVYVGVDVWLVGCGGGCGVGGGWCVVVGCCGCGGGCCVWVWFVVVVVFCDE